MSEHTRGAHDGFAALSSTSTCQQAGPAFPSSRCGPTEFRVENLAAETGIHFLFGIDSLVQLKKPGHRQAGSRLQPLSVAG